MYTLVVAEKPSVAREIAAVVGASERRDGFIQGGGYRVTWALGHLVTLAAPEEMHAGWKLWSMATLPMLPDPFRLSVVQRTRAQYRVVERLLQDRSTSTVIAATDAGREGELIFRFIVEQSGRRGPWQRLWLNSLTADAIRAGLQKLEPGARYDGLAAAARARSEADWLAGLNLTRAYTLRAGTLLSVGRVQTPTLALVVQRDREIAAFVPRPYLLVEATFEGPGGRYKGTFFVASAEGLRDEHGRLRAPGSDQAQMPVDSAAAQSIVQRVVGAQARVLALERMERASAPPQLYDLAELQRDANRLHGMTAMATLDAGQALYEQGAISYPRTDSRHLTAAVATTLPEIAQAIAPSYAGLLAESCGVRPLRPRYVNDAKVTDHHAILPTARLPALRVDSPEARVYDLICRRFLMAWHLDRVEAITRVVTAVGKGAAPDLFFTQARVVEVEGWSVLELRARNAGATDAGLLPPDLARQPRLRCASAETKLRQTEPPKPFTDASLITAMEHAGRLVVDEALAAALRERGLGTPATRAAIVETLIARTYLARDGRALRSTSLGQRLVDVVDDDAKSPALTGQWELRLRRIERGEEQRERFMHDIRAYVSRGVDAASRLPSGRFEGFAEARAERSQPGKRRGGPKSGRARARRAGGSAPFSAAQPRRRGAARNRSEAKS